LFLITTKVSAIEPKLPGPPGQGLNNTIPANPPVFETLALPTQVVGTKTWAGLGVLSVGWVFATAMTMGDPALIAASILIVIYAMGGK